MIRAFATRDVDHLIDVWYRASLVGHPFLSESFLEKERNELVEHWLPVSETWIYESNHRLVGFISMIGNEVGGVFVDPDYQGRGIGRALMDHVRTSRTFLELNVFEKNQSARRFYSKYGFKQIDSGFNEEAGQEEIRLRLD